MPTTRTGHVRRLLNAGKARIVCHVPFVIRLTYETPEEVQPLFGGKRYIMSGQSSGGKYLLALGYGRKTFSASKCKILQRNAGLVWL